MRKGRYVLEFENPPAITCWASVGGRTESEGPLGDRFDMVIEDDRFGMDTWESAESKLHSTSIGLLLNKAGLADRDIDCIYAGDLLNQCASSGFGIRDFDIPMCGMYGACSTSVLTMITAAVGVSSGYMRRAIASTSSHFCAAEKQFRLPLEYGGQRPQTSQRTVTGAGSALIEPYSGGAYPVIRSAIYGRIADKGVTDANNMGAAMAPAAAQTIADFLGDTGTSPGDYDLILTGDLGRVGSELLAELAEKQYGVDLSGVHRDTGLMMYFTDEQDVHSGGSGCGCCAAVLCSKIFEDIAAGRLGRVLVVATGALLSTVSPLQGESIPGIAHGVLITNGGENHG